MTWVAGDGKDEAGWEGAVRGSLEIQCLGRDNVCEGQQLAGIPRAVFSFQG